MKKIIILLLLSFFLGDSAFAATWVQETEQTVNFISAIMNIFSTEMLLKIIFAIVVIVLTFITSKFVQGRLFGYLESANIGDEGSKEEIIGVISRTVNIIVLIVGFSITLWVLGVDLGIFMWGIGFGIGFTLRTFLTNFISGIIIVSQGSYHIGDLIEIGGKTGTITKINTLFTSMEELTGVTFNIPNVKFFEDNVRNFHTNDKRRIDVDVVVDYGTDILKAKQVLQKVTSNFPMILAAPEADILIQSLWDKWVELKLRFWIHSKENFITIQSNVTETINLAFAQTDIHIAYPKIDISWSINK